MIKDVFCGMFVFLLALLKGFLVIEYFLVEVS